MSNKTEQRSIALDDDLWAWLQSEAKLQTQKKGVDVSASKIVRDLCKVHRQRTERRRQ